MELRKRGYSPAPYIANNAQLKACLDFIGQGINGQSFDNLYRTFTGLDYYMAAADFADYCSAHEKIDALYADKIKWNQMSLNNIAASGIFAADRSIADYAKGIWGLTSLK
jgi:starch phosphorylase